MRIGLAVSIASGSAASGPSDPAPIALGNNVLSLDVEEGVTLATLDVANWLDQRGSGLSLSEATNRPVIATNGTDGLGQIEITGVDLLDINSTSVVALTGDFTICGVVEVLSAGNRYALSVGQAAGVNNGAYLLSTASTGSVTGLQFNLTNDALTAATVFHTFTAPSAGDTWLAFMMRRSGTTLTCDSNMGPAATTTAPASPITADSFGIGGLLYHTVPALHDTKWAAIDVFDDALSDGEWATLEAYYESRFTRCA